MAYIHRIWMGSPMPDNFKAFGNRWAGLNPEWTVVDWTEEMIFDQKWENQAVLDDLYRASRQPGADMVAYYTQVADVVDYELVYRYGGWYVNTDLKPLKPLSVLEYDRALPAFAYEDDIHLVNMAMYAPIKSELFEIIIQNLPIRYFGNPGGFMNATTGVQLIMQSVGEYFGGLTRFPRNVFNPIHFSEFEYGDEPNMSRDFPDETVAVHLWGHRTNRRGQRVLEV